MQERYCECGARVMVQFSAQNDTWRPVFWVLHRFNGGRVFFCPSCGNPLEIDSLR
jgi:hypothetical protein